MNGKLAIQLWQPWKNEGKPSDEETSSDSDSSFGFRLGRNAPQATGRAQSYRKGGHAWVVARDLEKFFDRMNHAKLRSEVSKRVHDRRVSTLSHRFLKAEAMEHDALHKTVEGALKGVRFPRYCRT